ncbi:MAG: ribosome small subunit-dependent GTPase A [Candidatus Melainabacteria bacterium GWF2_32_7]|nr:MAG: ribosome small subunit-dependent GTPase A [Candidatus Melainabacteria bacterium GWF2_32_7]
MLIGDIIKIHSNFYYVRSDDIVFECKLREKLKKEKAEVFVGDSVRLTEVNTDSNQAAITEILERKNFIPRPSIANIDQIIVVAALHQPELDFIQLNRYIAQAKLYNIPAVICINKADIENKDHIKQQITSIYEPLEYKIIFTSAKTGMGIEDLKKVLEAKRSVLCGTSGVGKSSLLNKLHPGLSLKTKQVSAKTLRGTHATRHIELLDIPLENHKTAQVADTPGFSYLKFDNVLPAVIDQLFDEIGELSKDCYYSDCLHLTEDGCNILVNIDKIALSRYESYKIFVNEALEYKEKLAYSGHKVEEKFKTIDTRNKNKVKIVKLNTQAREKSRKTQKQKMNLISILENTYYNSEEDSQEQEN